MKQNFIDIITDSRIVFESDIYKGVSVDTDSSKELFQTGNFVVDWFNAMKFCILSGNIITFSSEINHFEHGCDIRYMTACDDGEIKFSETLCDEGIEFFIPKGSNLSWSDLKQYCDGK